jgi:hypothetical protein
MNGAAPKRTRSNVLLWILLLVPVILVLAIVSPVLYTAYSSRNARFVITPEGLEIHGSMYGRTIPRQTLVVEDARIAHLNTEPAVTVTSCIGGISAPGFAEGWFRLSSGGKALLFVTDEKQVVSVPTRQGYVVLLSPMRPELFLATLQRGTSVPAAFGIVPSSSWGMVLMAVVLLPMVLVGPMVLVWMGQRRPLSELASPGALYADHLVEIAEDSVLFRHYYFPTGSSKRVMFSEVDHIRAWPLTLLTGKWWIWGSSDLTTWFPADWDRPGRTTGFLLVRKGKTIRIGFTVEDEVAVREILRRQGLLREG